MEASLDVPCGLWSTSQELRRLGVPSPPFWPRPVVGRIHISFLFFQLVQGENKMGSGPEKIGKIGLTAEKKTLLITLYAKAADYRSKKSILHDKMAYEIVSRLDNDNIQVRKSDHDDIVVVRAKQFDVWLTAFIKAHQNSVVLNLGCGLDTRVTRIAPPLTVDWFDVDYPEVIELRKNFYSDSAHYHMIASSVTAK